MFGEDISMEQPQEYLPAVDVNGQKVVAFVNGLSAFAHILIHYGSRFIADPTESSEIRQRHRRRPQRILR